jgi:acyl-CoA oxidase
MLPLELDRSHKQTEAERLIAEEYHLLSSCAKIEISDIAQETIAECRVACGGLGFSRYSIFGEHLAINDVNRTWEGDNNILTQQVSRILLKNFSYILKGKPTHASCTWMTLDPVEEISEYKGDLKDTDALIGLLKFRVLREI